MAYLARSSQTTSKSFRRCAESQLTYGKDGLKQLATLVAVRSVLRNYYGHESRADWERCDGADARLVCREGGRRLATAEHTRRLRAGGRVPRRSAGSAASAGTSAEGSTRCSTGPARTCFASRQSEAGWYVTRLPTPSLFTASDEKAARASSTG